MAQFCSNAKYLVIVKDDMLVNRTELQNAVSFDPRLESGQILRPRFTNLRQLHQSDFVAKKYFVKGIRFKMNPLLNVKDDGWFQWTNILQITIRHSALALVSSFREMLLKSS